MMVRQSVDGIALIFLDDSFFGSIRIEQITVKAFTTSKRSTSCTQYVTGG